MPPNQLIYGFGFFFRVDESCISKHLHERRVKVSEEDGEDGTTLEKTTINKLTEDENAVNETKEPPESGSVSFSSSSSSSSSDEDEDDDNFQFPDTQIPDHETFTHGEEEETKGADETVGEETKGADEEYKGQDSGTGKKRISAKERRQMKKGVNDAVASSQESVKKPAKQDVRKPESPPKKVSPDAAAVSGAIVVDRSHNLIS